MKKLRIATVSVLTVFLLASSAFAAGSGVINSLRNVKKAVGSHSSTAFKSFIKLVRSLPRQKG